MRFTRTHALQHAIQHAIHHALHHPHPARPAIARHLADGSTMEDLEQRMLLSAVPTAAAPLVSAKAVSSTHVATTLKRTTPTVVVAPAAVADPTVTDKAFVYRSFAGDPLFAPGGPSINDVSQGELGDCYLLSVVSSVAKTDSTLVRQLVAANSNGTYTVTFAGKQAITVDSELATLPDGRPAYAQLGADNSIWVAIVEKAYADYVNPKVDAYATISGGWMGDAFTALGLKSTSAFAAGSSTVLATLLQKDLKAGDFVTFGTTAAVGPTSPLVAGHAYEIDSVAVNKQGAITAVTLRNPWGNDIASGGYVTVTPQQAFAAFAGLSVSHA